MSNLHAIYSRPQFGHGIPVFSGWRRQTGGGILGAIARFALPILRNVGKRALNVAAHTVKDVASGKRGIGDALQAHGKREVLGAVNQVLNNKEQASRKRKAKTTPKRINKRQKPDIFNNKK